MTFQHNETIGKIRRLTYVNKKGNYSDTGSQYSGHKKPIGIDDRTFQVTDTVESSYKWTIKRSASEGVADIKESDEVDIDGEIFIVKGVKLYTGITFSTTKVLLSK